MHIIGNGNAVDTRWMSRRSTAARPVIVTPHGADRLNATGSRITSVVSMISAPLVTRASTICVNDLGRDPATGQTYPFGFPAVLTPVRERRR